MAKYLSKKKLNEIKRTTLVHEVLGKYNHPCVDVAPGPMWDSEDNERYDIANELETKLKEEIIKILET